MKFIDFFAGIGGFHSGLESAGYEMIGWVEWDKYARKSYEALYDTEGKYTANDIKSIKDGKELPTADLWAFGSPCTNISMAGNRVGLKGEQSSMFFEVIRLLNDRSWEEKPAVLLMENVKNLLSSNRGWDFTTVINKMDEAGYCLFIRGNNYSCSIWIYVLVDTNNMVTCICVLHIAKKTLYCESALEIYV